MAKTALLQPFTPPTDPSVLRALFLALSTRNDVAGLLGVTRGDLHFWFHRSGAQYRRFDIPKRSGGKRRIHAPEGAVKLLQRRLLVFLNVLYRPRLIAHGFIPVRGRGIRSNASEHVDRRWLLNIDLEDFFATIHFGRVRGLFASYGIQLPAADLLAHICCYNSVLPQGAPTSPAVSNLVCRRLDLALQRFASAHGCRVTRYADDITFSTMRQAFDPAVASIDYSDGQRVVTLGAPLRHLIQSNSFRINETKTRARGQSDRQDVTGLTVNKTVNVRRSYVRSVRGMLYAAERHGLAEAQAYFESKYSRTRHPNLPPPEFLRSLEGRLAFLSQIKGTHNPVVTALWNRACRLDDRLTPRVGMGLIRFGGRFSYAG